MARQIIRLTESDLHRIIKKSVNRILREDWQDELTDFNRGAGGESWHDSLKSQYPDRAERMKALNDYYRKRNTMRKERQSPEERAREAEWERKYNIEHGIVDDDEEDFDFDKAVEKFEKEKMRSRNKRNPISQDDEEVTVPQSLKFSGKSPEELEQMMRDMGFVR